MLRVILSVFFFIFFICSIYNVIKTNDQYYQYHDQLFSWINIMFLNFFFYKKYALQGDILRTKIHLSSQIVAKSMELWIKRLG